MLLSFFHLTLVYYNYWCKNKAKFKFTGSYTLIFNVGYHSVKFQLNPSNGSRVMCVKDKKMKVIKSTCLVSISNLTKIINPLKVSDQRK